MLYSDFTLKKVKKELGITLIETEDLFAHIEENKISDYLSTTLRYSYLKR